MLTLEISGNNALIVDNTEDPNPTVNLVIQPAFISTGQDCTCLRRVLVKNSALVDTFIKRLVQVPDELRIGRRDDKPKPFMGGDLLSDGRENTGGSAALIGVGWQAAVLTMQHLKVNSPLLSPEIIDLTGVRGVPDEEYFSPLITLIRYSDFNEALFIANQTCYRLLVELISLQRALFN